MSVAPDQTTFVSTFEGALLQDGASPSADAGGTYQAVRSVPVALTAGGSRDAAEDIVGYDWDLDGDGTYELTSDQPVVEHAFDWLDAGRFSLITRTTSGITSPARWTMTWSCGRMSLRATSSSLCSVARPTVTPAICTGVSQATGVAAPVRPT